MSDNNNTPVPRLKTLSIMLLSAVLVVGCGSSSNKKSSSSSSSSVSSQTSSSDASSSTTSSSSEGSSSESSATSSSETSSSEGSATSSSETSSSESSATSSSEASNQTSSSPSTGSLEPEPNDFLPFPEAGANSLRLTFSSSTDVDRFDASANPGVNPQISHSGGKLKIAPQWNSTSDKLVLETSIPLKNMSGGSVSFNLYLTEDYIDDSNLYVQIYLKDVSGRYANTKAAISGSGKTKREWITHTEAINSANLDFVTSGFNINDINTIGIEILANGKPVEIGGDIYIDNLLINFGQDIPVDLSPGHDIVYPTVQYPFSRFARNYGHDNLVLAPGATGLTITGWSPTATPNSTGGSHTVLDEHSPAQVSFTNALIEMIVTLTQEQVDNNITLQVFSQNAAWAGSYSGYRSGFRAGDNLISFQLADVANLDRIGLSIGVDTYTGPQGTPITIKAIGITLDPSEQPAPPPPAASSVDFEADAPGAIYTGMGWNADNLNASVVNIASVTGLPLPVHGTSTKALKVSVTNYNAMPKVTIAVPSGKTLADYDVHVDIYFPVNSAGVASDGDNGWKNVWLFAGTSLSGGAQDTHADYQSSLPNGSFHDQWHTFEFAVDPVKAALLSGNIEIAVGINRSGSNHANDAYYIDSIRLIER